MRRLILAALFFALLGLASAAVAQTVKNPTTVVFTVSTDHASITKYELGFFLAGAAEPVQVADLGTAAPAADNTLSRPLPTFPLGVTYVARVRAYAGTITSDWSAESNPFYRSPAAPSAIVVR